MIELEISKLKAQLSDYAKIENDVPSKGMVGLSDRLPGVLELIETLASEIHNVEMTATDAQTRVE